MTGVADLYLFLRRPHSRDARTRLAALFRKETDGKSRFVVLSWKRTGSNLLCGILHNHPEITMHNELFNPIDIFTYHPAVRKRLVESPISSESEWNHLGRDLYPEAFLEHIWSGKYHTGEEIKPKSKAVGFKSFPDHWTGKNEDIWQKTILEDHRIKKIILCREDELAVFVSMLRAEQTGHYMTLPYPKDVKLHIDPAKFQAFVNNYRDTFQRKYKSPTERRDTFRVSYEQLADEDNFNNKICPLIWRFLGIDEDVTPKKLLETVKQSEDSEDFMDVISNYEELEFSFRHTDILHFSHARGGLKTAVEEPIVSQAVPPTHIQEHTWSLLLPICSRKTRLEKNKGFNDKDEDFNVNRFSGLAKSSQYSNADSFDARVCWDRLQAFSNSLKETSTSDRLKHTVCVVGIDKDDAVFSTKEAKELIRDMLPTKVITIDILPIMYGHVCRIWSHLANKTGQNDDFIVLLGDDIVLLDEGWQEKIEKRFQSVADRTGLPFGAACVALNDESFPGFPTFPVVHRWHVQQFGRLLPKQFVNQGGDPYLYELYSRWEASSYEMSCRLCNTLGGDKDARYEKYAINWKGQVLTLSTMKLEKYLGNVPPKGICVDVVVPSYRCHTNILQSIVSLRSSIHLNVRFWIVIDNTDKAHHMKVKVLANEMNKEQKNGNYFVNVIEYGENRGASYARNTGYNYSTADWVLFLDDDVVPDAKILDAYAGAIRRYPDARVFVGSTTLPPPCNLWTDTLSASNVMYFYGVARHRVYPPWGVTANILVRGSRFNHTIQFKHLYPKTGGGEDIDFVFQMKELYGRNGSSMRTVVSVPGAKALHPWWNEGRVCYRQIRGWAWGDSLCITEWPDKTYLSLPNWLEFMTFILLPNAFYTGNIWGVLNAALFVAIFDHTCKALAFYPTVLQQKKAKDWSTLRAIFVTIGASTVISSQEITRVHALLRRCSIFSICRRMDWFDGQARTQVLDIQLRSGLQFLVYCCITWYFCDTVLDQVTICGSADAREMKKDTCHQYP